MNGERLLDRRREEVQRRKLEEGRKTGSRNRGVGHRGKMKTKSTGLKTRHYDSEAEEKYGQVGEMCRIENECRLQAKHNMLLSTARVTTSR
jgi:hypothetical protein